MLLYVFMFFQEVWLEQTAKQQGYLSMLHNFVHLVLGQVPENVMSKLAKVMSKFINWILAWIHMSWNFQYSALCI